MAWSKVNPKHSKPLAWWWHKVLCEFGYSMWYHHKFGQRIYYKHLQKCFDLGYNIYGDKYANPSS